MQFFFRVAVSIIFSLVHVLFFFLEGCNFKFLYSLCYLFPSFLLSRILKMMSNGCSSALKLRSGVHPTTLKTKSCARYGGETLTIVLLHYIFIITQLCSTSHPRSTVVLLDTGTPGTSKEIYSEGADGGDRTRNPSVINRVL